jgi:hypothetical protein
MGQHTWTQSKGTSSCFWNNGGSKSNAADVSQNANGLNPGGLRPPFHCIKIGRTSSIGSLCPFKQPEKGIRNDQKTSEKGVEVRELSGNNFAYIVTRLTFRRVTNLTVDK